MKSLFKKLFCRHEWEIFHIMDYTTCGKALLICKKCNKLKVKKDYDNSTGTN